MCLVPISRASTLIVQSTAFRNKLSNQCPPALQAVSQVGTISNFIVLVSSAISFFISLLERSTTWVLISECDPPPIYVNHSQLTCFTGLTEGIASHCQVPEPLLKDSTMTSSSPVREIGPKHFYCCQSNLKKRLQTHYNKARIYHCLLKLVWEMSFQTTCTSDFLSYNVI